MWKKKYNDAALMVTKLQNESQSFNSKLQSTMAMAKQQLNEKEMQLRNALQQKQAAEMQLNKIRQVLPPSCQLPLTPPTQEYASETAMLRQQAADNQSKMQQYAQSKSQEMQQMNARFSAEKDEMQKAYSVRYGVCFPPLTS